MKSKLYLIGFAVFFSLFLFLGIKASQILFSDRQGQPFGSRQTSSPAHLQESEGTSSLSFPFTLIIFVDDLTQKEPLLEGVWLNRSGEQPGIKMFFPVFPSQAEDGKLRDLNLRGAFWLEEPYLPSRQFTTILRDRNLTWNYLLILDRTAVSEIGSILGESNPDAFPSDQAGLNDLIYSGENRLAVQENQALFIRKICQQLPLPAQHELLQRFLDGFGGHLGMTGITHLAFYNDFQGAVQCHFPTLNLPIY